MPKQNIGEAIAREREKKGLSQRQLANAIGISNAELSKIESGERELPNPKILKKISKHIDLNYNNKEKNTEELWKSFFKTIAIKERENRKCQQNFMPKKYWQNILEMESEQ